MICGQAVVSMSGRRVAAILFTRRRPARVRWTRAKKGLRRSMLRILYIHRVCVQVIRFK
jgi:hypothetical protein